MGFQHRSNMIRFAFHKEQATVNLETGLDNAIWNPGVQGSPGKSCLVLHCSRIEKGEFKADLERAGMDLAG